MQILKVLTERIKKLIGIIPFTTFFVITQGIQIGGVVAIALMNGKEIECALIYLGMVATRNTFGPGFHAKSFLACTSITWTVFYLLTAAVPPLFFSIYTSMFFGIAISFFMSHLNKYLCLLKENNFNLEFNCNMSKLLDVCNKKGMTEEEKNFLVQRYVFNEKDNNLKEMFNLKSVQKEVNRIREKYCI